LPLAESGATVKYICLRLKAILWQVNTSAHLPSQYRKKTASSLLLRMSLLGGNQWCNSQISQQISHGMKAHSCNNSGWAGEQE